MIHYALVCDHGHEFESWFPSGAAYDEQRESGLVSCPFCGSGAVEKQVMAPRVSRTDIAPDRTTPRKNRPMTLLSEKEREIRAALKALHGYVTENAEDVGERFPEEARRMHEGDAETRSIYGRASFEETRALIEEGIDVLPLPALPGDKN